MHSFPFWGTRVGRVCRATPPRLLGTFFGACSSRSSMQGLPPPQPVGQVGPAGREVACYLIVGPTEDAEGNPLPWSGGGLSKRCMGAYSAPQPNKGGQWQLPKMGSSMPLPWRYPGRPNWDTVRPQRLKYDDTQPLLGSASPGLGRLCRTRSSLLLRSSATALGSPAALASMTLLVSFHFWPHRTGDEICPSE